MPSPRRRQAAAAKAAAPRGSVAGASGDAGVEYRRAVAAYAVAAGLAGAPLIGFGVSDVWAQVHAVTLETDDAVDDIRLEFDDGWTAFVQAKRHLRKGKPLDDAVAQWARAARQAGAIDQRRHRFVIVAGSMSEPMRHLKDALDRQRTDLPGGSTGEEEAVLQHVRGLLVGLDDPTCDAVLRCGVVCLLPVEEPESAGAREAVQRLSAVLESSAPTDATAAWETLCALAGRTARLRGGYRIHSWLLELRGKGVAVSEQGSLPAAMMSRRQAVVDRYRARLRREGATLDLRSIGAALPPLPLDGADAQVDVGTNPDDDRAHAELVWAFLRRGRVVLTGLPGGGKSTAIRALASRLWDVPDAPVPIRVSLRDVDEAAAASGFRDRLIAAAVRDAPQADRAILHQHLDELLTAGDAALLLDSLDETYDRRGDVVSDVDNLMQSLPRYTTALLATRDVAYGQAQTLGWPTLRLRPPEHADRVIHAVLTHAAAHQQNAAQPHDAEAWVSDRAGWVSGAISRDATLRETPLMPVLLAVLASERAADNLPAGRARVLAAVVDQVVQRHELKRAGPRPLGPWQGTALATATAYAFAREGRTILESGGKAAQDPLLAHIEAGLAEHFGISPGEAHAAALDAVRFFDESGIFVASGADSTISPRIALFAEIGDAIRAAADTGPDLEQWAAARLAHRQIEPLVLAAGLSRHAAAVLADAAHSSRDRQVLHAAVRARREGAELEPEAVRRLVSDLAADVSTGAPDSWASWELLLSLPLADDLVPDLVAAAQAHPSDHQALAQAQLDLLLRDPDDLRADPASLLAVLAMPALPRRGEQSPGTALSLKWLRHENALHTAQRGAADILLGSVDAATPWWWSGRRPARADCAET